MDELPNVLWIGGPPGSGKTTVARHLAQRWGLRRYNSDAHTWSHRDRAVAAGNLAALRFEALTSAERAALAPRDWVAMSLQAERGPMTVADLRALPDSPLTIAEGTQIVPRMLPPGSHVVWLMPSYEGLRARLEERHRPHGAPEAYLEMARWVLAEVDGSGGPKAPGARDERDRARVRLRVDGWKVDETVAEVERSFADRLAAGPRAVTRAQRRGLVRYANRAIVDQHLSYLARPWTTGDPSAIVRSFQCECGDPGCDQTLELTIASFPDPPDPPDAGSTSVLAPGHGSG